MSEAKAGYRILDEIEPVTEASWALHPQLAFYGSMMLATRWLALISAANSFLLGHPRRKTHAAIGFAAVMAIYAIAFVAETYFPKVTWKYWSLLISAIHLWLAYYFTEEHEWAAEMFEQAGGKVLSFWNTIGIVRVLAALLRGLVQRAGARLFLRMVR